MAKLEKIVKVNEEVRDMMQKLWLEYYQKLSVVKGLIDDHQYDENPEDFLDTAIFKAYENKTAKALYAYEAASEEMKDTYLPESFVNSTNYTWKLDFEKCEITYTQA